MYQKQKQEQQHDLLSTGIFPKKWYPKLTQNWNNYPAKPHDQTIYSSQIARQTSYTPSKLTYKIAHPKQKLTDKLTQLTPKHALPLYTCHPFSYCRFGV